MRRYKGVKGLQDGALCMVTHQEHPGTHQKHQAHDCWKISPLLTFDPASLAVHPPYDVPSQMSVCACVGENAIIVCVNTPQPAQHITLQLLW